MQWNTIWDIKIRNYNSCYNMAKPQKHYAK